MTLTPWHDGLRLDDGPLDRQHQALLDLMTQIVATAPQDGIATVAPLLRQLFDHCATHFADEEAYMAAIHYPHLNEHRREHRRLLRHLDTLLSPTCEDITIQAIMDCVRSLVVMHILNDDLEIRHHIHHDRLPP